MTPEAIAAFEAAHEAPPGFHWVCGACGKHARNSVTHAGASQGWDESCFLNSSLTPITS